MSPAGHQIDTALTPDVSLPCENVPRGKPDCQSWPAAGGIPTGGLFATELAHVPAKVAAALGGWKDPKTMTDIYQQPAGAALYTAALEVGKTGW